MTSIILNGKKQLIFGSVRSEQSSSYIVTRYLYQIIDYELCHIQISNFSSISYNTIIPYVQIYHALTFL